MDKIKTILTRTIFPLGIACIFLLSTAFCCINTGSGGGSGTGSGSGSGSGSGPEIEKWDLSINCAVFLNYDVRPFLDDYKNRYGGFAPSDWNELVFAHGITDFTDTWLMLNDLLPENLHDVWWNWNMYPEDGPEVRFDFHLNEGDFSKTYKEYDDLLCRHNTVHDAPLTFDEYICDFHAQTITTSKSRISINWDESYVLWGQEMLWIDNLNGVVDTADPFFKSTTGEDEVAVRNEGGERVVVENTVPSNLRGESVIFHVLSTRPVVTDVLSQPVIRGGRVTTYKWKVPSLAKINLK